MKDAIKDRQRVFSLIFLALGLLLLGFAAAGVGFSVEGKTRTTSLLVPAMTMIAISGILYFPGERPKKPDERERQLVDLADARAWKATDLFFGLWVIFGFIAGILPRVFMALRPADALYLAAPLLILLIADTRNFFSVRKIQKVGAEQDGRH